MRCGSVNKNSNFPSTHLHFLSCVVPKIRDFTTQPRLRLGKLWEEAVCGSVSVVLPQSRLSVFFLENSSKSDEKHTRENSGEFVDGRLEGSGHVAARGCWIWLAAVCVRKWRATNIVIYSSPEEEEEEEEMISNSHGHPSGLNALFIIFRSKLALLPCPFCCGRGGGAGGGPVGDLSERRSAEGTERGNILEEVEL